MTISNNNGAQRDFGHCRSNNTGVSHIKQNGILRSNLADKVDILNQKFKSIFTDTSSHVKTERYLIQHLQTCQIFKLPKVVDLNSYTI